MRFIGFRFMDRNLGEFAMEPTDLDPDTAPQDGSPGLSLGPIHRRHMLHWLGGAGMFALLAGCGGGDGDGNVIIPTPTPSPTPTPVPPPTPTPPGPEPLCVKTPPETSGPYPADGTNTAPGETNNVLTKATLQREDIRASFLATSTVAAGVRLRLTITVLDGTGCKPIAGRAVYVWQADAQGLFSLYTRPEESYLRGIGVTDANGQVNFTTIVPGCLKDRWPHIYAEIFPNLFSATRGTAADLVTQLIVPAAICTAAYADTATYPGSTANFSAVSIAADPVFGDNSTEENDARTLTVSGDVSAGFVSTVAITMPAT